MADDGPYEILPYAEIDILKKQIAELQKKNASSDETLEIVKRLAMTFEKMLQLFEGAAANMKNETYDSSIGKKVNEISEQNEIIAESLLSIIETIKSIKARIDEEDKSLSQIKAQPAQSMPMQQPDFSIPPPMPSPQYGQQGYPPPDFSSPLNDMPPQLFSQRAQAFQPQRASPGQGQLNVPMPPPNMRVLPTGSFNDLVNPPKKDKKQFFSGKK